MIKNSWNSNTHQHFGIGMIVSLLICYGAFNWTTYPKPFEMPEGEIGEIIDIEIPLTIHEKKKVKPPVAFTAEKIDPIIEDKLEFINDDEPEPSTDPDATTANEPIDLPAPSNGITETKAAPIVEPSIEDIEDELPILIPERMPVFDQCNDGNATERKKCSDQAVLNYVNSRVKYPAMARENGIQGKVIVRFVIDKEGRVTDKEILREPGYGLGNEVLRVLNDMPDWIAGRQNGRPVAVYFNLPIKFSLH